MQCNIQMRSWRSVTQVNHKPPYSKPIKVLVHDTKTKPTIILQSFYNNIYDFTVWIFSALSNACVNLEDEINLKNDNHQGLNLNILF